MNPVGPKERPFFSSGPPSSPFSSTRLLPPSRACSHSIFLYPARARLRFFRARKRLETRGTYRAASAAIYRPARTGSDENRGFSAFTHPPPLPSRLSCSPCTRCVPRPRALDSRRWVIGIGPWKQGNGRFSLSKLCVPTRPFADPVRRRV